MTKSLTLLIGALTIGLGATAQAAEPVRATPPSWTGLYVGANAGILSEDSGRRAREADTSFVSVYPGAFVPAAPRNQPDRQKNAIIGGGQIGYNYQIGALVLGAETDLQAASSFGSAEARRTTLNGPQPVFVNPGSGAVSPGFGRHGVDPRRQGYDYLGTVRGRVGYLALPDLLLYATGGFAYGERSEIDARGRSHMKTGYVAGGGIEYALDQNWSVKGEALYYEFEKSRQSTTTTVVTPVFNGGFTGAATVLRQVGRTIDIAERHGVIGRIGLNYRFTGW